jgi:hypothetical protein
MHRNRHGLVGKHEVCSFPHNGTGNGDLVEVRLVHEHIIRPIFIQKAVIATVYYGEVDFSARVESLIHDFSRTHVFHFCPHESTALTGLHVLKLDNSPELSIKVQDTAVLNIVCCCHVIALLPGS